jgi:hypothetical protein
LRQKEEMNEALLINTLLQRGDGTMNGLGNRFNGFSRETETVKTVPVHSGRLNTSLKRGVNKTCAPTM